MYICMYVYMVCVNVCSQEAKIVKKITDMKSNIFSRTAHAPFFYFFTVTLIGRSKLLAFNYFMEYLANGER